MCARSSWYCVAGGGCGVCGVGMASLFNAFSEAVLLIVTIRQPFARCAGTEPPDSGGVIGCRA